MHETPTHETARPGLAQLPLTRALSDFLSARNHSADFTSTRGRLIRERISPLALVLAIGLLAWIPLEFFLVEPHQFALLATARLVAAGAAISLYLALRRARTRPPTRGVRWRLPLAGLLLLPGLLYAVACLPGAMGDTELVASGYAFFPVITATVFAIFPLTLRELACAYALIIAGFLAVEATAGTLLAPAPLQLLWLMLLAAAICAWASANHLRTLLQLYRQATRDLLTGLLNRRALGEQLEREARRAARYGRPLTLIMIDLDRFKRLNDEYGHLVGDQVLREFARRSAATLRDSDILGRWGGEEFLVGLVETGPDRAEVVAERIRRACADTPLETEDGSTVPFTVSLGVGPVWHGEPLDEAIRRVDDALYEAKRQGRNRVTVAPA